MDMDKRMTWREAVISIDRVADLVVDQISGSGDPVSFLPFPKIRMR